jgi:hypothetical protein
VVYAHARNRTHTRTHVHTHRHTHTHTHTHAHRHTHTHAPQVKTNAAGDVQSAKTVDVPPEARFGDATKSQKNKTLNPFYAKPKALKTNI